MSCEQRRYTNTTCKLSIDVTHEHFFYRLVYPKYLFNRIEKEDAEALLRQLPFPACYELVDRTDDDEDDEDLDMMADLLDACKLSKSDIDVEELQKHFKKRKHGV